MSDTKLARSVYRPPFAHLIYRVRDLSSVCQNVLTTGRSVCRCLGSIWIGEKQSQELVRQALFVIKLYWAYLEYLDVPVFDRRMLRVRSVVKVYTSD